MTESILRRRHSTRSFLDKPIEPEIIKEIIADAQLAPSWCNTQPWKAYIATGELAKELHRTHYDNNLNARSWAEIMPPQESDWQGHTKDTYQGWMDTLSGLGNDNFADFLNLNRNDFHAPVIVYITIPKNATAYSAYDTGAFGYGITLAAAERGIGSIPAYEFIRYPQEIRDVFDMPENESLLLGIGLGYADNDPVNDIHQKTERQPLESVYILKDKK